MTAFDTLIPKGANMTDEELEDFIADAINDSFDMDWTGAIGARAILKAFAKEGLVVLPAIRPSTHPCGVCGAIGDQDHSGHCSQSW